MCIKKSFPICILRKFNLKPCFKILLLSKNKNIRVFQHYFHIKSEPQLYQLLRRKLTVSQIKLGQLYKPSYLWSTSRRSLHSVSSHLVCMLLSTKVYQGSFRLGIRKYFFTERVVKDWNSLSWEMLEGFKRYVDVVVKWTHFSDGVGKYFYDSMILLGKQGHFQVLMRQELPHLKGWWTTDPKRQILLEQSDYLLYYKSYFLFLFSNPGNSAILGQ